MAQQTLFSLLSRAPWWISALVGVGLFAVVRLALPDVLAAAVGLPFIAVALYAAWRQLRVPSDAKIARRLESLRDSSWQEFSNLISEAFRRDGYGVTMLSASAADLQVEKQGRITLVCCKRWKAVQTGVEPIRQLHQVRRAREAADALYIATGDFTTNARKYALDHHIRLLNGTELAQWLRAH